MNETTTPAVNESTTTPAPSSGCCAALPDGSPCGARVAVVDETRRAFFCAEHARLDGCPLARTLDDDALEFARFVHEMTPDERRLAHQITVQLLAASQKPPLVPAEGDRPAVYLLCVAVPNGEPLLLNLPERNAVALVTRPGHEAEDAARLAAGVVIRTLPPEGVAQVRIAAVLSARMTYEEQNQPD